VTLQLGHHGRPLAVLALKAAVSPQASPDSLSHGLTVKSTVIAVSQVKSTKSRHESSIHTRVAVLAHAMSTRTRAWVPHQQFQRRYLSDDQSFVFSLTSKYNTKNMRSLLFVATMGVASAFTGSALLPTRRHTTGVARSALCGVQMINLFGNTEESSLRRKDLSLRQVRMQTGCLWHTLNSVRLLLTFLLPFSSPFSLAGSAWQSQGHLSQAQRCYPRYHAWPEIP
jgi:hypothetical protein